MHYFEVAPNQIIRPGSDVFTYASNKLLQIGQIVTIEVGKKHLIGVVMRPTNKPEYKTKEILSVIIEQPLPAPLLGLAEWLSGYYVTPLALVLQTLLPRGLTKARRPLKNNQNITERTRTNILFNLEQQQAIQSVMESPPATFLLQGVTGSGKTEIYKEIARQTIKQGKSVIVLVPEIALTSQLVSEFSNDFDNIMLVHSTISESRRHAVWKEALESTAPRIVIGARSALFTPLPNIGAILVDEAHEPSYKQEQAPRYSALRAATVLGASTRRKGRLW